MLVLDSLLHDLEDVSHIMSYLVMWEQRWVLDFTDSEIVDTLRVLLEKAWIVAHGFIPTGNGKTVFDKVEIPRTNDESMRSYWFELTPTGRKLSLAWEPPPEPDE